jgi:hypothetical protein
MKNRILTMGSELELFREKFNEKSVNPLPLGFLQQARVYGLFKNDVMVAGYTINVQAPYRYLGWIPEGSKKESIHRQYFHRDRAVEIASLWMTKEKLTANEYRIIYAHLIWSALKTGRNYIFAGTSISKIATRYRSIFHHVVYQGPLNFSMPTEGEIYYSTWIEMAISCAVGLYQHFIGKTRQRVGETE